MKLILTLTISILIFSCRTTTSESDQSVKSDEIWEMTNHTFTTNTYTLNGLLDTSYKTMLLYQMGILFDSIKSIIVRKYDLNRLTIEREFTLEKDGSKTLSNETIKQYDGKGNLISQIITLNNNVVAKTRTEYNDKGQVTKTIDIFRKVNDNPNDYNLDSAVAHRNDKRQFQYDTTISTYEYDADDHPIQVITSDTKGIVQEISVTKYSGDEKFFSLNITPNGDTTAKFSFKREGNLIKQINDLKEQRGIDTIWHDKDKIVKIIGHNYAMKMKYKDVIKYNDKGDEIESISYK